ncbi:MAG: methylmalonyl Co-A mutase-associated GTPase MeaB [Bacteroidales bacterium]
MGENKKKFQSALKVQEGIEQPSSVNPRLSDTLRVNKKPFFTVDEYVDGILKANRTILSKAITLIESSLHEHQQLAQQIINKCLPYAGKSIRIGITGVPGVGKSTFIEALGKYLCNKGHKLAVLAIDPSSERSKGSILGDKTRMEALSVDPNAFIRPSPSAGSLGGVARKTRETIVLCEAAGFDTIFVETVGVGQSETAVHAMVDFFLLLMLANAGDELQGIKRGIMEMADAIAINKADGENKKMASLAKSQYKNALHLFPPTESGWIPDVACCSAYTHEGIDTIWNIISDYHEFTIANNYFNLKRQKQAKHIMLEAVNDAIKDNFYNNKAVATMIPQLEKDILDDKISSYVAAQVLLEAYFNEKHKI